MKNIPNQDGIIEIMFNFSFPFFDGGEGTGDQTRYPVLAKKVLVPLNKIPDPHAQLF